MAGELRTTRALLIKHRFRSEIEIFPSESAADRIREHPKCPFRTFAFTGECEIDKKWYYIAANGSVYSQGTMIILLEK